MNRQLKLIDRLVAEGRESFTFADAQAALGVSATAAANVLRRLRDQGLVDVVTRGHYSVRPLGSLGTSTATDSLPLAVGAAFAGRRHRIAYSSAFSDLVRSSGVSLGETLYHTSASFPLGSTRNA